MTYNSLYFIQPVVLHIPKEIKVIMAKDDPWASFGTKPGSALHLTRSLALMGYKTWAALEPGMILDFSTHIVLRMHHTITSSFILH